MKKIVALTLLIMCVCSLMIGVCEDIDLSGLTESELLELRNEIDDLLSKKPSDSKTWYSHGLGQFLPDPNAVIGRDLKSRPYSQMNTDGMFSEIIDDLTYEEYELYIDALKNFGYNENIQAYGFGYSAVLNGKYEVTAAFADMPSESSSDYMMIVVDIIS